MRCGGIPAARVRVFDGKTAARVRGDLIYAAAVGGAAEMEGNSRNRRRRGDERRACGREEEDKVAVGQRVAGVNLYTTSRPWRKFTPPAPNFKPWCIFRPRGDHDFGQIHHLIYPYFCYQMVYMTGFLHLHHLIEML